MKLKLVCQWTFGSQNLNQSALAAARMRLRFGELSSGHQAEVAPVLALGFEFLRSCSLYFFFLSEKSGGMDDLHVVSYTVVTELD